VERSACQVGGRSLGVGRRVAAAFFYAVLIWPSVTFAVTLSIKEVAPGVFEHQGQNVALDAPGHDDIANIGFIVGSRCVAVIDTGGSVRTGRALRAAVRARTKLPICYVIDTHVHVDHLLGNFAFVDDHPHFVGHASLASAITRSRDFFIKNYAGDFDGAPTASQLITPDTPVSETMEIDLGDRRLTLQAWPNAHTDCDLTVFDEKTATLWTGDLLFRERIPALDGSIKGWIAAIDVLSKKSAKLVIPGHGSTARDIGIAFASERHYLQTVADGVRAAIANGESIQWAIAHVALDEKSQWLLWDTAHAHNLARAYEELEWE
jgi:quinoprotein relay system zinc metallohydrolase 2